MKRARPQRGVALLDALLAMLVLGIGVLSIVPLLANVAHSNATAWQRALAAQLAQHKLEDLRGYTQLEAGAAGVFGYDEIRSNAGGAERSDGSLLIASGEQRRSDQDYVLSWSVEERAWCEPASLGSSQVCTGAWRSQAKTILVKVSWTDERGEAQALDLRTAIVALDPSLPALALLRKPQNLPPRQAPP